MGVSWICFFKCLLLPKYLSYLYKTKSDLQLITHHFMEYSGKSAKLMEKSTKSRRSYVILLA